MEKSDSAEQLRNLILKSDEECESPQRIVHRKGSLPPPYELTLTEKDEDADEAESDEDDEEDSYMELPAELPPPPDGGWGWAIVAASFLCNMIVDGVAYSFSPFLQEFSEYFDAPQGTVSWISSLLAGVYLGVGPIVSALTNRFGCRIVCIAGGVISSLAYASTIFANSVVYLMVTQGVIAGFGFGMIYLPAVVCVGYYFEARRAMATGIAVCGSGVGTMLFPPLMNFLIERYGWQGTNLIIAGIILNTCWLGGLMRPLEVPKMSTKVFRSRLSEVRRNSQSYAGMDGNTDRRRKDSGRVLNPDPGVNSHINLVPGGTSFALPTIEEGDGVQVDETKEKPRTESNGGEKEETKKLVPKSGGHPTLKVIISKPSPPQPKRMPRNLTQPHMVEGRPQSGSNGRRTSYPKVGSVPNFDRRHSRANSTVNMMKLIPATSKASYTSISSIGKSKRNSVSYGRVTSDASFSDIEGGGNTSTPNPGLRRRKSSKGMMIPPMSRQDIFYTGSITNLPQFKMSQQSMASYRESTFNLQATAASTTILRAYGSDVDKEIDITDDARGAKCCGKELCGPFTQMMDCTLIKNPVFMIIGVANCFGMLGFYTPFVYLPLAAIEKGIPKTQATFLISIIGITNTIGRVLAGLIADRPWASALWINNFSIILSAVCVFVTPFAYSYGAFVAIAVFFGFFVSSFISLFSIIIVDLMGLEMLISAFGLLNIFRGVAGIIGPPLSGSIYDATDSYNVSFFASGGLLFVCAFMHCIIPLVQKCYTTRYVSNMAYLDEDSEGDYDDGDDGGTSPDDESHDKGIILRIKPKNGNADHVDEKPEPVAV